MFGIISWMRDGSTPQITTATGQTIQQLITVRNVRQLLAEVDTAVIVDLDSLPSSNPMHWSRGLDDMPVLNDAGILADAIAAKQLEVDKLYGEKSQFVEWDEHQIRIESGALTLMTGREAGINKRRGKGRDPFPVKWRDVVKGETFQIENQTQWDEFFERVHDYIAAVNDARFVHHDAIAALPSTEAVAAYDINADWPA